MVSRARSKRAFPSSRSALTVALPSSLLSSCFSFRLDASDRWAWASMSPPSFFSSAWSFFREASESSASAFSFASSLEICSLSFRWAAFSKETSTRMSDLMLAMRSLISATSLPSISILASMAASVLRIALRAFWRDFSSRSTRALIAAFISSSSRPSLATALSSRTGRTGVRQSAWRSFCLISSRSRLERLTSGDALVWAMAVSMRRRSLGSILALTWSTSPSRASLTESRISRAHFSAARSIRLPIFFRLFSMPRSASPRKSRASAPTSTTTSPILSATGYPPRSYVERAASRPDSCLRP